MRSISVSVPGSIMLLGEHAVLHKQPAVCCAIDQTITLELQPRQDQQIIINSDLGQFITQTDNIIICQPFTFILAALKRYLPILPSGVELTIQSSFAPNLGLGSSAAVTAATVACLNRWLKQPLSLHHLFKEGLAVIHAVQGLGSGADLAASLNGGIVFFQQPALVIERLAIDVPLVLIYSGYKTPTIKVINQVQLARAKQPELFMDIFQAIGECSEAGFRAIQQRDWVSLGQVFAIHQGLQQAMNVSNADLEEIIAQLCAYPSIYGAKISGSGLGDCVVGIGDLPKDSFPKNAKQQQQGVKQIRIQVNQQGLSYAN